MRTQPKPSVDPTETGAPATERATSRFATLRESREAAHSANNLDEAEHRAQVAAYGDRSSADQALRASEARYRRLFESAKDGILILDAIDGRIIDVNPYLARLLGYEHAEFIGKLLWEFGPLRDVVASQEAFAELLARDYVAYDDLPLETKTGKRVDVGFVSNVYDVEGERFIQCNIRDITQRKAAERQRINLEGQLRAAQKMEAIGSLAGGIAHDFNNLLSVILCYTKFVLDALPEGSALRDDLSEVEKASERAAGLVRQLLAFGSKQVMQPVRLDLNEVVERTEKMLRRIVGEDIDFETAQAPDLGLTMADPAQIEQVIMNVVINARDAMPAGGKLTLETRNVELDALYAAAHQGVKPGPYVLLAITDTGTGMEAATRARMFEPFFTTKPPGKGTGLGLSTAYGIVKQSGGNIGIESEVGHGTRFEIYLPRDTSLAMRAEAAPRDARARVGGNETILIVEDEDAVRDVARRILAAAGYTVLTASGGREALELCASHVGALPLVLSDVVMPHMSGPMFASQLLRLRPGTKVLFMSGYSGDAAGQHGVIVAGTPFVEKPFNAAALTRMVRETLDGARSDDAARAQ